MGIKFVFAVLILCVSPTFAQKAADLEKMYGKPTRAYSITEHIWMTPEYSPQGEICRMRLYPRRIGATTDFLAKQLPFEELTQILNQLWPPALRGAKKDVFGFTDTGGGVAWTTFPYEKVTFIFITPFRVDARVLTPGESFSISVDDFKPAQKKPPSYDDFLVAETSGVEIVTINWNNRICAAN